MMIDGFVLPFLPLPSSHLLILPPSLARGLFRERNSFLFIFLLARRRRRLRFVASFRLSRQIMSWHDILSTGQVCSVGASTLANDISTDFIRYDTLTYNTTSGN